MFKAKKILSASLEDYLEMIFNLASSSGSNAVRGRDIAEGLGVSRSSVTGALRLLGEKGLVNYKPYGFVTLTDNGKTSAGAIVKRHNTIESFFVNILGVDRQSAKSAACRAEHALGAGVMDRLTVFMDFVDNCSRYSDIAAEFKTYCQNNPQIDKDIETDDR